MRNRVVLKTLWSLVALVCASYLFGCSASMARKPGLSPALSLEQIPRSGYEILGTVEGTGKVTRFLCLFSGGDKQFGYTSFGGGSALGLGAIDLRNAVAAATYDAISKVPEADMLLPLTTTASKSGLGCLIGTERATVRGKAIRIKSDR